MCCCPPSTASSSLVGQRNLQWNPSPNTATVASADGLGGVVTTGTATARPVALAAADLLQSLVRTGFVSAAAINSVAGWRAPNVVVTCGSAGALPATAPAPIGRWRLIQDFGISDAVLNGEAKMFVGMQNGVAAPTAVDPATLSDAIGVGCNTGNATLHFYSMDNAGNVQNLDLGANFPIGIGDTYRVVIACRGGVTAGQATFDWQVMNLKTGARASGTALAPSSPRALATYAPRGWRATGPVNAAAVGIDQVFTSLMVDY